MFEFRGSLFSGGKEFKGIICLFNFCVWKRLDLFFWLRGKFI